MALRALHAEADAHRTHFDEGRALALLMATHMRVGADTPLRHVSEDILRALAPLHEWEYPPVATLEYDTGLFSQLRRTPHADFLMLSRSDSPAVYRFRLRFREQFMVYPDTDVPASGAATSGGLAYERAGHVMFVTGNNRDDTNYHMLWMGAYAHGRLILHSELHAAGVREGEEGGRTLAADTPLWLRPAGMPHRVTVTFANSLAIDLWSAREEEEARAEEAAPPPRIQITQQPHNNNDGTLPLRVRIAAGPPGGITQQHQLYDAPMARTDVTCAVGQGTAGVHIILSPSTTVRVRTVGGAQDVLVCRLSSSPHDDAPSAARSLHAELDGVLPGTRLVIDIEPI